MTDDMDEQTRIHSAIALRNVLDSLSPDNAVDVMRRLCKHGHGIWTEPVATATGRPGTHLHEISIWGITASGVTPHIAVINWIRVAHQSGLD